MKKHRADLKTRVERQREFQRRREPGDLLVYVNRDRYAGLTGFLNARMFEGPVAAVMRAEAVRPLIEHYVELLRESYAKLYAIADDSVPCAMVYWGIGGIMAAMTGLEPAFDSTTSWLEPNLAWDRIQTLRFDPENRWVQWALSVNQALWKFWEEDFFILPFLHRSPLDAANGLRGSELLLEMHVQPERVKRLADWCADWSIQMENFLDAHLERRREWGTGAWSTWLPDRAVFVNGDPVCLISPAMQQEFERPATAKLFTKTGGGFFHNHTAGLYQVGKVAETPGLIVQEFYPDPKHSSLPEVMFNDPRRRDEILASSLRAPIMIESIAPDQLDRLLPIVARGRFILAVRCPEGLAPETIVQKVRRTSRLR